MTKTFDAIVVGARVAGSPTAMLLARKGYDVLLVDRATFPSDTISTHLVHPPGIDALQRWGLLDQVLATGCPAIDTYAFDFGPFTLSGAPGGAASGTARGGPCWTSCWWTPPARLARRCAKASAWNPSSAKMIKSLVCEGTPRAAQSSPSTPVW